MAESLVSLDASSRLIASLSGLEHFVNLNSLNLGGNIITEVNLLNSLTNLYSLRLSSNQIFNLSPLSSLTNLRSLNLDSNQISNLTPLSGLTSLNSLQLDNNNIGDLTPLSGLTSLNSLQLDNNNIGDLTPLSGLTSLDSLQLSYKQISDLGPLVANSGLGPSSCIFGICPRDRIDLQNNRLSSPDTCTDVGILRSRGAIVYVDFSPCGLCLAQVHTDHKWNIRQLPFTFQDPVVIAGPPTYHGTDPGVIRLRNITNNSFDIRFQEWLYKDGWHTQENISCLVLSPGRHYIGDGSIWEAGTFSLPGTGAWNVQSFSQSFPSTPALFLTTQTYNGSDPIAVRARNVTNTGFEAALFEEEDKMDGHTTEVVGYLAVYSPQLSGTININGTDVPYLLQAQSVDHRFVPVSRSLPRT
jgi:hypothetical protein